MIGPVAVLDPMDEALRGTIGRVAGDGFDVRFPRSASRDDFAAVLAEARYAVVRAIAVPAALLGEAPNLALIHQWGTGIDGIPLEEARARGITVARSPGVNAPTVADLTVALMLSVLRRIPQTDAALRAGTWETPQLWTAAGDLDGARVGLVGFGAIGQLVARRLAGFDCEVTYWRPSGPADTAGARYATLDDVLAADIVSLHLPLTADTRGFLSTERIAAMTPGAILINTSRGPLVDEAALVAALASGHLGGAGLDVFAQEPVAPDNPLLALANTVVLPHVGGRTRTNLDRMVAHWAGNIRRHAEGRPIPQSDLV